MVPIELFPDHIRLELLDPAYKKERDKSRLKEGETVFAGGADVYKHLKRLGDNRPDLSDPSADYANQTHTYSLKGANDDFIPPKLLNPQAPHLPEESVPSGPHIPLDLIN